MSKKDMAFNISKISRELGVSRSFFNRHSKKIGVNQAILKIKSGELKPKKISHKTYTGYLVSFRSKRGLVEVEKGTSLTTREWADLLGEKYESFYMLVRRNEINKAVQKTVRKINLINKRAQKIRPRTSRHVSIVFRSIMLGLVFCVTKDKKANLELCYNCDNYECEAKKNIS